ncbi:MAG: hypothetical protein WC848_01915 [Parcubacteria group bacterium]|jgi:hypothetical protein
MKKHTLVLTFFQKNKLKILLAVFCVAFFLPLVYSARPVSAEDHWYSNVLSNLNGESSAGYSNNYGAEGASIDSSKMPIPKVDSATWFQRGIAWLLKGILSFVAVILSVAQTIFGYIVDANNMKAIMSNQVVYDTWRTVRDVFNIAFIMVLLFSAFATIFQASTNFNYKNILLNLIIMALLVNFSFPISRFIIDASNMLMFGLLNALGGTNSFMTLIEGTGIQNILKSQSIDLVFLISAIIFTFILAITLLIIAVLLLIRTIALTIYIIFSPIAFVGQIAPGTKLASSASEWWTDFMKYCFSGPIIIFFLFVASKLFTAISASQTSIQALAKTNTSGSTMDTTTLVSAASFFALPIIILWYGIIIAQKSGIAGAGAVVGYGQKKMKQLASAPHKTAWWAAKKTGIPGGVQQKWANWKKTGYFGSDRQAEREARYAGKGMFAVKGSLEKEMRRKADEHKKNLTTDPELKTLAAAGDAGAALRLAEDKKMDQTTYDAFIRTNSNAALRGAVNAKVKQNRNDLVAINKSNDATEQAKRENVDSFSAASQVTARADLDARISAAGLPPTVTAAAATADIQQHIANQQMGALSAEQWNDQDWTATISQPAGPTRDRAILAAQVAWANLKTEAKAEVRKRLSGNNSSALSSIGIV